MCFWLFSFGVFGSGSVPGASFGFRQGCWLCFMRRMLGFMEAPLPATNNVTVYALVKVCFLNEDFVVKEVFFPFFAVLWLLQRSNAIILHRHSFWL